MTIFEKTRGDGIIFMEGMQYEKTVDSVNNGVSIGRLSKRRKSPGNADSSGLRNYCRSFRGEGGD